MGAGGPWTTPSDLAEYTFCPRAHYYRRTREAPSSSLMDEGSTYHRKVLSRERWRDDHPGVPWLAVLAGVMMIVLAVAIVRP